VNKTVQPILMPHCQDRLQASPEQTL